MPSWIIAIELCSHGIIVRTQIVYRGTIAQCLGVAGLPVSDNSINIQRRHGYAHQGIPICARVFPGACWCFLVLVSILVTSAVRIWEIGLSFTLMILDCYGS